MALGVVRVSFSGEGTQCTGHQMATVLAHIVRVSGPVVWYEADVVATGPAFALSPSPIPKRVGHDQEVLRRVHAVAQFEAGVFVAVPTSVSTPRFRDGGLFTEDPVDAELADSIVEVRAFDTTFIEVISSDETILREVSETFGASIEATSSSAWSPPG